MSNKFLKDSVSEAISAVKKDANIAKAGMLLWSGVGLYSVNMIVKHAHRLGKMEANKDFIEWVEGLKTESGE